MTTEAEDFAALARKHWVHVTFDPKTGRGSVTWGVLGTIQFWESANDSAVNVTLGHIHMKARAGDVSSALHKIHRIVANTGL